MRSYFDSQSSAWKLPPDLRAGAGSVSHSPYNALLRCPDSAVEAPASQTVGNPAPTSVKSAERLKVTIGRPFFYLPGGQPRVLSQTTTCLAGRPARACYWADIRYLTLLSYDARLSPHCRATRRSKARRHPRREGWRSRFDQGHLRQSDASGESED